MKSIQKSFIESISGSALGQKVVSTEDDKSAGGGGGQGRAASALLCTKGWQKRAALMRVVQPNLLIVHCRIKSYFFFIIHHIFVICFKFSDLKQM